MDVSKITLLPIRMNMKDNDQFGDTIHVDALLEMTISYYLGVGYVVPWIGYFATLGNDLVGSCGFKGGPKQGKVEIAYGTMRGFEGLGVATELCRQLTLIAVREAPAVRITARTLPDNLASAAVLKKNGYTLVGNVMDEDDGDVLEWEYSGHAAPD